MYVHNKVKTFTYHFDLQEHLEQMRSLDVIDIKALLFGWYPRIYILIKFPSIFLAIFYLKDL